MATKEEYKDTIMRMYDFCIASNHPAQIKEQFTQDLDFLAKLANEHFEEKAETNLEHFKDAIIDNEFNFAVKNGKVEPCGSFRCDECSLDDRYISCCEMRVKWLLCKYEKQKYKLSQFEYDLLNAYKVSGMLKSIRNYSALFELYEKGYFKDIDIDMSIPIHEILANCEVIK